MTHKLKIAPEYFNAVASNKKKFEVRKNDRGFNVGDFIVLEEYENGEYTDNWIKAEIIYIITHEQFPEGLQEGYCVFGIKKC